MKSMVDTVSYVSTAKPAGFSARLPRTKIVVIGEGTVGKTSIASRFSTGSFRESYLMTIGSNFFVKNHRSKETGEEMQLVLWDTAGQERFRGMLPNFYKGAKGVVLVFDITSRETFDHVQSWLDDLKKVQPDVEGTLVGNKLDLDAERVVSHEEGNAKGKELGMAYFETSAKTGENIEDMFSEIAKRLLDRFRVAIEKHRAKTRRLFGDKI